MRRGSYWLSSRVYRPRAIASVTLRPPKPQNATACGSRDVRRQLILLVDHLVVLGKRRERLPRHHMHHFVAAPFELVKHSGSASAVGPKSARRRRRSRPGLFQCRLYPLRCPILNLGKLIRFRGRGTKKARFFARSHPRKIFPS
jgi:hypothetical protein